jgi:hypothetical protein
MSAAIPLKRNAAPRLWIPRKTFNALRNVGKKILAPSTTFKEDPGRPMGKPHGSFVSDLVENQTCVLLCRDCNHKFDHVRNHYYKDRKFPYVQAMCDGCKTFDAQSAIFIHESLLADPNGRIRHGQSWTPR